MTLIRVVVSASLALSVVHTVHALDVTPLHNEHMWHVHALMISSNRSTGLSANVVS